MGVPLRDAAELRAAIVQDAETDRVLMLAWMNDEAERLTRETGEAWFWSRSRERLWKKGETSGNTLAVEELRDDCDGDALLVRVRPNGPACHTNAVSCFAPWLWRTVAERAKERPARLVRRTGCSTRASPRARARSGRRPSKRRSPRSPSPTSASSRRSPTSGSTATCCSPRAGSTRRRSRTSSARRHSERTSR